MNTQPPDDYRAEWLRSEAQRIKHERRWQRIDTALIVVTAIVIAGIILIVLGAMRP